MAPMEPLWKVFKNWFRECRCSAAAYVTTGIVLAPDLPRRVWVCWHRKRVWRLQRPSIGFGSGIRLTESSTLSVPLYLRLGTPFLPFPPSLR